MNHAEASSAGMNMFRLYRHAARELPPEWLDREISDTAHKLAISIPNSLSFSFVPALAASILAAVGLALLLAPHMSLDTNSRTSASIKWNQYQIIDASEPYWPKSPSFKYLPDRRHQDSLSTFNVAELAEPHAHQSISLFLPEDLLPTAPATAVELAGQIPTATNSVSAQTEEPLPVQADQP